MLMFKHLVAIKTIFPVETLAEEILNISGSCTYRQLESHTFSFVCFLIFLQHEGNHLFPEHELVNPVIKLQLCLKMKNYLRLLNSMKRKTQHLSCFPPVINNIHLKRNWHQLKTRCMNTYLK